MKSDVGHDLAIHANHTAGFRVLVAKDEWILVRDLIAGHAAGPEDVGNEPVQLVGFFRGDGSRPVNAVYSAGGVQSVARPGCLSLERRAYRRSGDHPRKLLNQICGASAGSNRPVSTDLMAASRTAMFFTP